MRYNYEFKKKCVELYRKGIWPETPVCINQKRFRNTVRSWVRLEEANGPEALRHNNQNKKWTAEERYELIAQVLAVRSCTSVAISAGISSGLLYQWVRKYKIFFWGGIMGLQT